jgi:hypothetical protein
MAGVKVGFVGVGPSPQPREAAKTAVAAARTEGAQVLVVLGSVGRGEAKRIADDLPDLTAIVVGSEASVGEANTLAPPIERLGDVLVIETGNHLQQVAVLDLWVREGSFRFAADGTPPVQGSFSRVSLVDVHERMGKDPEVRAELLSLYKRIDDRNRERFRDRLPRPSAPGAARYVGVEECKACHVGSWKVWKTTQHARAFETLQSAFKGHNLDCVGCHVTGYDEPGGSTVGHVERLEGVQCETCHGPGSLHVKTPLDPSLLVGKPKPTRCLGCHHPPHVEGFDAETALGRILGPGHGK